MTENYTREHIREYDNIGMPITTSTGGETLEVPVIPVINQCSLGLKLFCITIDGRTNLARCKAILESTFDNTGVFDLGIPLFVIECLAHLLANKCKTVVMDMRYDCGRVYTEVTRSNIQC